MGACARRRRLWRSTICFVLAMAMATEPSRYAVAQAPAAPVSDSKSSAGESAGKSVDITYVSPTAAAVVVLRPAQIMNSPMREYLPVEVATAAGLKYLGADPANIEQVTAFVDIANPTAPAYGLAFKFLQPIKASDIPEQLRAHAQLDELGGKKYLKSGHPMLPSFYGANSQTLVVATDDILRRLVAASAEAKSGPVIDRVSKVSSGNDLYAAVSITSLRPLVQIGLAQSGKPIPPEAKPFLDALNLLDAAELTVNISKAGTTSLVAHANDDAAAEKVEKLLADATAKYKEQMTAEFAKQKNSEDPVERAAGQYAERMSARWTSPFMPQRMGSELVFFASDGAGEQQKQLVTVAVIGILVALLLPAIQAAREAARRNQSMNNLKQIEIGLLTYENTKKSLPPNAIYSADDKPLLSWRVQILPYIGEEALYKEFHLDEPWNSEHNAKLISRMPRTYANPNLPGDSGKTNYLAVVGNDCIFKGTKEGTKLREITDGLSKTINLVEADVDRSVEWTKPADWRFDPEHPLAGIGHLRPGGCNAGFGDASVQFLSNMISPVAMKALVTRAGGEIANPGD